MDRRSFLGSVIGFLASTPFIAKSLLEPIQIIPAIGDLSNYKFMYWNDLAKKYFQAPPIKGIESFPGAWVFTVNPLDVTQTMAVSKLALYHKESNKMIVERSFDAPVFIREGDKLKVDYTLKANTHDSNIDNVVKSFLQQAEW